MEKPQTGSEIKNPALATALQQKAKFSRRELNELKVVDLSYNSFIKVQDAYYKPADTVALDEFALDEFELRLKRVEESMLPMTPQTDGASRSQEGGRQASTGMKTRVQVCRNV